MKIKLLTAACLLLNVGLCCASNIQPLQGNSGTWKNQRGSILSLQFLSGGALTGTFTNEAPGSCQGSLGIAERVYGTYDASVISFVVDFPQCSASTTWNGHISADHRFIDTMWLVSVDGPLSSWNNNYAGHDEFTATTN